MQSICRTCLNPVTDKTSYAVTETLFLSNSEEMISVNNMLKSCVPELALDMIQDSVICHSCLVALSTSYKFKLKCLKNEKKIQEFISACTRNLNFTKILYDEEVEADSNLSKIHTCCVCKKTFMSEIFLKKHMRTHENQIKYECGICGKLFNESVRLKVHILTHSNIEEDIEEKEQLNVSSPSQNEADFDESVSSKVAPFMLATSQNLEYSGNFEIVNVLDCKDELYKPEARKIWTDEETLQFLSLCKRHVKDMYQGPKKSLWSLISKKLAAKSIHVLPDQCESKWKNLIRTYNTVKAKLARDPKAHTKFHYLFEFDELMSILSKCKPHNYNSGKNYQNVIRSFSELQDHDDSSDILILDYNGEDDFIQYKSDLEISKVWSSEETLAFLDAYRQRKSEVGSDSDAGFWTLIAEDLQKCNYTATGEQCESKWKSMKRTYRNVKARISDNKKKTGMTKFSYFNMVAEIVEQEESKGEPKDAESLQQLLESDLSMHDVEVSSAKKVKLDMMGDS